jgi:hypothetical protein
LVLGPTAQFQSEVAGSTCWVFAVVAAPAAGANAAAPTAHAAVPVNTVATLKAFLIDSS